MQVFVNKTLIYFRTYLVARELAQVDQSQWNAYYGYGQGYDPYAYGADAHGAYAGYPQYPQQVRCL